MEHYFNRTELRGLTYLYYLLVLLVLFVLPADSSEDLFSGTNQSNPVVTGGKHAFDCVRAVCESKIGMQRRSLKLSAHVDNRLRRAPLTCLARDERNHFAPVPSVRAVYNSVANTSGAPLPRNGECGDQCCKLRDA